MPITKIRGNQSLAQLVFTKVNFLEELVTICLGRISNKACPREGGDGCRLFENDMLQVFVADHVFTF